VKNYDAKISVIFCIYEYEEYKRLDKIEIFLFLPVRFKFCDPRFTTTFRQQSYKEMLIYI